VTADRHASHEPILERALTGELASSDPALRDLLATCEECRMRYEKMCGIAESLDAARAEEREAMAAVAHEPEAPGDAPRVDEILRALARDAAPRAPERASPRRPKVAVPLVALAIAAALVLAVRVFWNGGSSPIADPGVTLGAAIPCDSPRGIVDDYGTFAWRYSLPDGGWFEVEVFDEAAPSAGRVARSPRLDSPAWTPSEAERKAFPRAIRWEVVARDSSQRVLARGVAHASRSR